MARRRGTAICLPLSQRLGRSVPRVNSSGRVCADVKKPHTTTLQWTSILLEESRQSETLHSITFSSMTATAHRGQGQSLLSRLSLTGLCWALTESAPCSPPRTPSWKYAEIFSVGIQRETGNSYNDIETLTDHCPWWTCCCCCFKWFQGCLQPSEPPRPVCHSEALQWRLMDS